MKLTVIGCAGSFPGPDSPASCYLIEAPFEGRTYRLVLDLGSGALGNLQRACETRDIDAIVLSHMHADHCFDLASLYVMSKYHPDGAYDQIPVMAPAGSDERMCCAYGIDEPIDMSEQFVFQGFDEDQATQFGPFAVTSRLVDHPIASYAVRIATEAHALVYSGDTAASEALVELATGADLFLCEASFVESKVNPPNIHMTGAEAGDHATRAGVGRLLITHIPAWTDRAEVEADVKTTFDGDFELVSAGSIYEL